jgi:Reverse transcriptase (RNA-dependent DNA polymerase)
VLIDSSSNKSHGKFNKMLKWIREQAIPTADQAPFIGWRSEFKAEKEVILPFKLTQFAPNRKMQHTVLLSKANTNSPTPPNLILGCDLIHKLGLELNFCNETPVILWDDVAMPMVPHGHWTPARINKAFATANEPLSTLKCAEENFDNKSPSMLAADYHEVKVDDMLPTHLNRVQCHALWHVLKKHAFLFSGKLGKLPGKPVHLELTDPTVKPYHGKAYQVPRSLLPLLKTEVDRLCKIGVLRCNNDSRLAAQGFGVPKKNNQIRFVTDFRMLNRHLSRCPFPLPSIQEIMRNIDGLTFVSVLDLNMGFWTIELDEASRSLTTVILPWGKYSYQRLAMGLSVSPDIYQEKMSSLFTDMENVICFIDDIALITNGSFTSHLRQLDAVLQRLNDNNLQVNGVKSSFCAHKAEFLGFVLTRQGIRPQVNKVEAQFSRSYHHPTSSKFVLLWLE